MPYKLSGTSVVKSDSGEVVKRHPTREKALAHLRALKANVEEGSPVVLGALLEGFDEVRHPRDFRGRWRAVVQQLQQLEVGKSVKVSPSFHVARIAQTGDRKYRVTMKTSARAGDRHVYAQTAADAADAALGVSLAKAADEARKIRAGVSEAVPGLLGALIEGR